MSGSPWESLVDDIEQTYSRKNAVFMRQEIVSVLLTTTVATVCLYAFDRVHDPCQQPRQALSRSVEAIDEAYKELGEPQLPLDAIDTVKENFRIYFAARREFETCQTNDLDGRIVNYGVAVLVFTTIVQLARLYFAHKRSMLVLSTMNLTDFLDRLTHHLAEDQTFTTRTAQMLRSAAQALM